MIQTILDENNILHDKCLPVTNAKIQVFPFVKFTLEALDSSESGVALAANQMGVPYRWYLDYRDIVYINPVILERSELVLKQEGCLSVPEFQCWKERYNKVTLQFEDVGGKLHILKIDGLDAQIAQHEIEHLEGKVIND